MGKAYLISHPKSAVSELENDSKFISEEDFTIITEEEIMEIINSK